MSDPVEVPTAAVEQAGGLARRLGLDVPADGYLARALVHRSWAFEHGGVTPNERLEFLGDAVLSLVVAELLFAELPEANEGQLAQVRAQAVRESELATAARHIDLGAHVLLGVGEAASGGSDKDSILADAFEALLGAVYLDADWDRARDLIIEVMGDRLQLLASGDAILDHKTALQELLAGSDLGDLRYSWTSTGPDHAPTFTVEAQVGGEVFGRGVGSSKKRAEEAAAAEAWRALRDRGVGATD